MNMKKTIAALAAGAVAVSAMATTVSALADTSLTYNLVKDVKVNKFDAHKATFEYTINAIPGETQDVVTGYKCTQAFQATDGTDYALDQEITVAVYEALDPADQANFDEVTEEEAVEGTGYPTTIQLVNPGKVDSIVIKVASSIAGEQNKIFTYSSSDEALNYNAKLNKDTGLFTFAEELAQYTGQLTITVTTNVTIDANADVDNDKWDSIQEINQKIGTDIKVIADAGAVTPVKLNAFTKGGKVEKVYYAPFKTAITDNKNITAYLQNEKGYHNVGAVLNDAIENYESVTFTFNTATNPIAYGVKAGTYKIPKSEFNGWNDNEVRTFAVDCEKVYSGTSDWWADGTYAMALDAVGGDTSRLIGIYAGEAWAGDSSFLSFDQHLYQGTLGSYGTYSDDHKYYASENTKYVGFDWTGYNLFQGALIINENLTMSLAETDYFDWTATSLSFDWDAIMDGAMTSNDYAVYLHSMKLATSNTWYWDNMVVTLTAGAAEDGVDAEAGVEADDEELAEEEVTEEEVVEEEVEEEVEVEVANPTTGNASVALAVIPVALAAAAVVAKKRS